MQHGNSDRSTAFVMSFRRATFCGGMSVPDYRADLGDTVSITAQKGEPISRLPPDVKKY